MEPLESIGPEVMLGLHENLLPVKVSLLECELELMGQFTGTTAEVEFARNEDVISVLW